MTQHREFIMLAHDATNFGKFGVALVHALFSRPESISCMISMTRVPRSIESSRWKTRWGVYFKTTCFAKCGLQSGAMRLELTDYVRPGRAKDADEDVCVFQIGGDIHLVDGHQARFEFHFARDNSTELALEHFIYAQ